MPLTKLYQVVIVTHYYAIYSVLLGAGILLCFLPIFGEIFYVRLFNFHISELESEIASSNYKLVLMLSLGIAIPLAINLLFEVISDVFQLQSNMKKWDNNHSINYFLLNILSSRRPKNSVKFIKALLLIAVLLPSSILLFQYANKASIYISFFLFQKFLFIALSLLCCHGLCEDVRQQGISKIIEITHLFVLTITQTLMLISLSARTCRTINDYTGTLYLSMMLYGLVIISTYAYALYRIKEFILKIVREETYDLISSDHILYIGYIGLMLCDVLYRLRFYVMYNPVDVYLALDPYLLKYVNMVAIIMTFIAILQNRVLAYDASSVKRNMAIEVSYPLNILYGILTKLELQQIPSKTAPNEAGSFPSDNSNNSKNSGPNNIDGLIERGFVQCGVICDVTSTYSNMDLKERLVQIDRYGEFISRNFSVGTNKKKNNPSVGNLNKMSVVNEENAKTSVNADKASSDISKQLYSKMFFLDSRNSDVESTTYNNKLPNIHENTQQRNESKVKMFSSHSSISDFGVFQPDQRHASTTENLIQKNKTKTILDKTKINNDINVNISDGIQNEIDNIELINSNLLSPKSMNSSVNIRNVRQDKKCSTTTHLSSIVSDEKSKSSSDLDDAELTNYGSFVLENSLITNKLAYGNQSAISSIRDKTMSYNSSISASPVSNASYRPNPPLNFLGKPVLNSHSHPHSRSHSAKDPVHDYDDLSYCSSNLDKDYLNTTNISLSSVTNYNYKGTTPMRSWNNTPPVGCSTPINSSDSNVEIGNHGNSSNTNTHLTNIRTTTTNSLQKINAITNPTGVVNKINMISLDNMKHHHNLYPSYCIDSSYGEFGDVISEDRQTYDDDVSSVETGSKALVIGLNSSLERNNAIPTTSSNVNTIIKIVTNIVPSPSRRVSHSKQTNTNTILETFSEFESTEVDSSSVDPTSSSTAKSLSEKEREKNREQEIEVELSNEENERIQKMKQTRNFFYHQKMAIHQNAYIQSLLSATRSEFRSISFPGRSAVEDLILKSADGSYNLTIRSLLDQINVDIQNMADTFTTLYYHYMHNIGFGQHINPTTLPWQIDSLVQFMESIEILNGKVLATTKNSHDYFNKIKSDIDIIPADDREVILTRVIMKHQFAGDDNPYEFGDNPEAIQQSLEQKRKENEWRDKVFNRYRTANKHDNSNSSNDNRNSSKGNTMLSSSLSSKTKQKCDFSGSSSDSSCNNNHHGVTFDTDYAITNPTHESSIELSQSSLGLTEGQLSEVVVYDYSESPFMFYYGS